MIVCESICTKIKKIKFQELEREKINLSFLTQDASRINNLNAQKYAEGKSDMWAKFQNEFENPAFERALLEFEINFVKRKFDLLDLLSSGNCGQWLDEY